MKYAFIDFDGTLVKLKTDHSVCKKALSIEHYDELQRAQYPILDEYEQRAASSAELILESHALLDKLNAHGYKVVIVSRTGTATIVAVSKRFGLPICNVISRDDTQHLKPDPKHVTSRISDIDTDSIVVGDSWRDLKLAEALGLKYYKSVSGAMKGLGYRTAVHSDEVYEKELKFLKARGKSPILDVGCGSRRGGDVCVDTAGDTADSVADACSLPFPDKTFQSVFMIHSLEHIDDYQKALREATRVLKVDGTLGIVIPHISKSYLDPTHKHHWTLQELNDIILSMGYEFIEARAFDALFDEKVILFSVGIMFKKGGNT